MAGAVLVEGKPVARAGALVDAAADVEVAAGDQYASRGGEKLAGALKAFGLNVEGLVAIDVGASTGGFTDCLLQTGVARVYAVDVGYGQLDFRLRQDPRVSVLERVNIRYLESLPEKADIATIDVSFISLEKVIPAVMKLLQPGARIVALVKPQFQVKRSEVGKKGVVRDPQVHAAVLGRHVAWGAERELRLEGLAASSLLGPAGNKEFFVLWRMPET
jgi:23S rRNA (cytidine1920-2'-O)/16S rRNA (cytidine1409-2'-O)-methyltransferase